MTDFNALLAQLQAESRTAIYSDTFKDFAIHTINPVSTDLVNRPSAVYNDGNINLKVTEHLDGGSVDQHGVIHEVRAQNDRALYMEGDWQGYAWVNRGETWFSDFHQVDSLCGTLVGCTPQVESGQLSQRQLHDKNTNTSHFTRVGLSDHKGARGYSDLFYGGAGNDILDGKTGDDELHGGNGNDVLYGGTGNDILYGDGGKDILFGEDNDDVLYGGGNDDYLDGGAGNDTLQGGDGDDVMYGQSGNDSLDGQAGNDLIYGNDGDDIINGGAGEDSLFGGAGNDTFLYTLGNGIDYAVEQNGEGDTDIAYIIGTTDLAVIKLGNDLILAPNDNDMLVLSNWYVNQQGIDYIYLADIDALYTSAQIASLATDLTQTNGVMTMDMAPGFDAPHADFSGLEPVAVEAAGVETILDAAAAAFAA